MVSDKTKGSTKPGLENSVRTVRILDFFLRTMGSHSPVLKQEGKII